eukprot:scaffold230635_cov66-Cyclotella_meneghiniana.AAC.1
MADLSALFPRCSLYPASRNSSMVGIRRRPLDGVEVPTVGAAIGTGGADVLGDADDAEVELL